MDLNYLFLRRLQGLYFKSIDNIYLLLILCGSLSRAVKVGGKSWLSFEYVGIYLWYCIEYNWDKISLGLLFTLLTLIN